MDAKHGDSDAHSVSTDDASEQSGVSHTAGGKHKATKKKTVKSKKTPVAPNKSPARDPNARRGVVNQDTFVDVVVAGRKHKETLALPISDVNDRNRPRRVIMSDQHFKHLMGEVEGTLYDYAGRPEVDIVVVDLLEARKRKASTESYSNENSERILQQFLASPTAIKVLFDPVRETFLVTQMLDDQILEYYQSCVDRNYEKKIFREELKSTLAAEAEAAKRMDENSMYDAAGIDAFPLPMPPRSPSPSSVVKAVNQKAAIDRVEETKSAAAPTKSKKPSSASKSPHGSPNTHHKKGAPRPGSSSGRPITPLRASSQGANAIGLREAMNTAVVAVQQAPDNDGKGVTSKDNRRNITGHSPKVTRTNSKDATTAIAPAIPSLEPPVLSPEHLAFLHNPETEWRVVMRTSYSQFGKPIPGGLTITFSVDMWRMRLWDRYLSTYIAPVLESPDAYIAWQERREVYYEDLRNMRELQALDAEGVLSVSDSLSGASTNTHYVFVHNDPRHQEMQARRLEKLREKKAQMMKEATQALERQKKIQAAKKSAGNKKDGNEQGSPNRPRGKKELKKKQKTPSESIAAGLTMTAHLKAQKKEKKFAEAEAIAQAPPAIGSKKVAS